MFHGNLRLLQLTRVDVFRVAEQNHVARDVLLSNREVNGLGAREVAFTCNGNACRTCDNVGTVAYIIACRRNDVVVDKYLAHAGVLGRSVIDIARQLVQVDVGLGNAERCNRIFCLGDIGNGAFIVALSYDGDIVRTLIHITAVDDRVVVGFHDGSVRHGNVRPLQATVESEGAWRHRYHLGSKGLGRDVEVLGHRTRIAAHTRHNDGSDTGILVVQVAHRIVFVLYQYRTRSCGVVGNRNDRLLGRSVIFGVRNVADNKCRCVLGDDVERLRGTSAIVALTVYIGIIYANVGTTLVGQCIVCTRRHCVLTVLCRHRWFLHRSIIDEILLVESDHVAGDRLWSDDERLIYRARKVTRTSHGHRCRIACIHIITIGSGEGRHNHRVAHLDQQNIRLLCRPVIDKGRLVENNAGIRGVQRVGIDGIALAARTRVVTRCCCRHRHGIVTRIDVSVIADGIVAGADDRGASVTHGNRRLLYTAIVGKRSTCQRHHCIRHWLLADGECLRLCEVVVSYTRYGNGSYTCVDVGAIGHRIVGIQRQWVVAFLHRNHRLVLSTIVGIGGLWQCDGHARSSYNGISLFYRTLEVTLSCNRGYLFTRSGMVWAIGNGIIRTRCQCLKSCGQRGIHYRCRWFFRRTVVGITRCVQCHHIVSQWLG